MLIDHLRGEEAAREALRGATAAGERLAASVLTKVEVLAGMRVPEERATRRLLDSLDWIAVDDELAERAGALANRYLPSHPGVDPVDYVMPRRPNASTPGSGLATSATSQCSRSSNLHIETLFGDPCDLPVDIG